MTGMDTLPRLLDLTPMIPATIGRPSESGSSIVVFQHRTMPRRYGWMARALSSGVLPGMAVHGRSSPPISSSPTSLLLVVDRAQSATVIDQVKAGRSICCAIWPLTVSKRYARHDIS